MNKDMKDRLEEGETVEGVGWISSVQGPDAEWIHWTQWKEEHVAVNHARKLLETERHGYIAARVIRVDWTIAETIVQEEPR